MQATSFNVGDVLQIVTERTGSSGQTFSVVEVGEVGELVELKWEGPINPDVEVKYYLNLDGPAMFDDGDDLVAAIYIWKLIYKEN